MGKSFDYRKKMGKNKRIHTKQVGKILITSAVASTLVFQPFIPVIQNGQLIGFTENSASAATLAEVEIFKDAKVASELSIIEGSEPYNLSLTLTGSSLADVNLVNPETVALFYSQELVGAWQPVGNAKVEVQLLPLTLNDLPAVGNLISGLTGTLTGTVSELVNTIDTIVGYAPSLIEVVGLQELRDSVDALNNLDGALEDLLLYEEDILPVLNADGSITVDFSDGIDKHLEKAVKDVVLQLLNDVIVAASALEINVLGNIPIVGDIVTGLINGVLATVTTGILVPVQAVIDEVILDTTVLTGELLAVQVLGKTTVTLNTTVSKDKGISGDVLVSGAAVNTNIIDLSLLNSLNTGTTVNFPIVEEEDTTAPESPIVNGVTSEATEVTGTAEAGSEVTVTFPDGETATGTTDAEGNFTVTIPAEIDLTGGEELAVIATDGAGNDSASTSVTVTDATAPSISPIDNATAVEGVAIAPIAVTVDDETSTVTAAGLPEGLVYDEASESIIGAATVNDWEEIELTRDFSATVTATDAEGNAGTASFVITVQRDANGNGIPDIDEDTTAPVSPIVNGVTSEATEVTGTAEVGSEVTVTFPDGETATGTTDVDGNFTVTIPAEIDLIGGEELAVIATDGSSNDSAATLVTVSDATAPSISPIDNATAVEGVAIAPIAVTVDDETSTVTAAGLPEGLVYDEASESIIGAATVNDWEEIELTRDFSATVTATDAEGNAGTASFVITVQRDANGNGIPDIDEDTTAPVSPIVNGVTSEATEVTGTAEVGSEVTVTFPDGETATGTTDVDGNFTVTIPAEIDLIGGEELAVIATDGSSNDSAATLVTVSDATAPESPIVNGVTSEATEVTGTAEAGSEVTVTFPDGATATGTTDAEGNFTVTIPAEIDLTGGEELAVIATDGSGNDSASTSVTVTDATAPSISPIDNATAVEGVAIAPIAVTVDDETSTVTAAGLPEGLVYDEASESIIGAATVNDWEEIELTRDFSATVTATDAEGNAGTASFVITVQRDANGNGIPDIDEDTTAPVSPIVNGVTSEATEVTGTAEVGSEVTVTFPDGETATGTTDVDGNFTVTIPAEIDLIGGEELAVIATDGSSNDSAATLVTVSDATTPDSPIVNGVTSEATEVTGTAEAGSEVTVTFPDGATATGTTDAEGNFTVTIPAEIDLTGGEELAVIATDGSGNDSASTSVTVTDATAPSISPIDNATAVEGVAIAPIAVTVDDETSTVTAAGLPEGLVYDEASESIIGAATVNDWEEIELTRDFSATVTATDAEGNAGTASFVITVQRDANGNGIPDIDEDTTAPVSPIVNGVTSEATEVTGTAEVGSEVTVTFPDGETATGTTDVDGNFTVTIPAEIDLIGGEELAVIATDGSSNDSAATLVTVSDATTPDSPIVNGVTSEATEVTGTAEAGSEVTVTFPDGATATGTTDAEGNFTVTIPAEIDLTGGEELAVIATDGSGNDSASTSVTVTDATAPSISPIDNATAVEGVAIAPIAVTVDDETSTVTAAGLPEGLVYDEASESIIGAATVNDWEEIELTRDFSAAVTATDAEGNAGTASFVITVQRDANGNGIPDIDEDTTAPVSPIVNGVTSEATEVTGTAEVGSEVTVTFPDGATATGTTDVDGNFTVTIPAEIDLIGGEELAVIATDGSSNDSAATLVTVSDATTPDSPIVNGVTSEATEVTGTAEAGSEVTVTFPDGATATGTTDAEGNFTVTIPAEIDLTGGEELAVIATDGSGNDSASTSVTVTDATAPSISPIDNATAVEGVAIAPIAVEVSDGAVAVTPLPAGVVYEAGTGLINGTPTVDDWTEGEETRDFEVGVTATDDAGNVGTANFVLTVQRDSDGNGIPDIDEDTEAPTAPLVEPVGNTATEVTGKAEANSEVTVTLPGGETATGTTDTDGNFIVVLPEGTELEVGDILTVVARDEAGNASAPTEAIVLDLTAPEIAEIADLSVLEDQAITDTLVEVSEESTVEVAELPTGLSFDESTNLISGTPVVDDWGLTEEEREFRVQVTATDEAGNKAIPETFVITVQRDTDGDGIPDVTDPDDDNDGATDEEEETAGTDPKDDTDTPEDTVAPNAPVVEEVTSEDTEIVGSVEPGAEVTVTFPNGETATGTADEEGNFLVVIPEDIDLTGGEQLEIVAEDEAGNVSEGTSIIVADTTAPIILEINDQTIVEGNGIEEIEVTVQNPGEQRVLAENRIANLIIPFATPLDGVSVTGLPEGVAFDVSTNTIKGIPLVEDWESTEESRDFEVTVTASDEAGNEATEIFTITVLRDTDGDGDPDVTDPDDDNDGATDEEEAEAGTDPKDDTDVPEEIPSDTEAPVIAPVRDLTAIENETIEAIVVEVSEPSEVTVDGLPNGLEYDSEIGAIIGTPIINDWTATEEERSFEVIISAEDESGNIGTDTFVIIIQRDTDGDGDPDVTDPDDDNDGATDEEEAEAGTDPKDDTDVPDETLPDTIAPIITPIEDVDVVENEPIDDIVVDVNEPSDVVVDGLPNGLEYDPETGIINGTPVINDWGSDETEREFVVTITAEDESGNSSSLEFVLVIQRDTDEDGNPNVTDPNDDNDGITDEEEVKAGTNSWDNTDYPESGSGSANNENTGKNQGTLPQTGESQSIVTVVSGLVLASISMVKLMFDKKKNLLNSSKRNIKK